MFMFTNLVDDRYNKDIDEKIVKFSKLLKSKTIGELRENFKGDEDYMSGIDKVEDLISDPNFAGAYDIEERRQRELEDFHETGYREGVIEIAKSMLKEKLDIQTISKCTGLSIDEINKLSS